MVSGSAPMYLQYTLRQSRWTSLWKFSNLCSSSTLLVCLHLEYALSLLRIFFARSLLIHGQEALFFKVLCGMDDWMPSCTLSVLSFHSSSTEDVCALSTILFANSETDRRKLDQSASWYNGTCHGVWYILVGWYPVQCKQHRDLWC